MAMDSNMQAKGKAQTPDSSAPGMVGCPTAAKAGQGLNKIAAGTAAKNSFIFTQLLMANSPDFRRADGQGRAARTPEG
jgi:hypothetical protein